MLFKEHINHDMLLFIFYFFVFSIIIITFVALLSKAYHYEIYINKQYVVMSIVHDDVYTPSYHS